jgi:hypothetical protein
MIIRGGNEGGLDGIDIWGSNIHVHDVEVSNKDECVTVKVNQNLNFLFSETDWKISESSKQHAHRKHLLQLERRLCHGLSRDRHWYPFPSSAPSTLPN